MKILMIDQMGISLDLCMRYQNAGHELKAWFAPKKDGKRNKAGDGIIRKVPDWKAHMQWADLIVVTDNSSLMEDLEPYRKKGYPIFGSNMAGAETELDRQVGQDLFKKCGIKTMDCTEFNDYDKAIEFVKKTKRRYVSKPDGDLDKALSYVSKSARDMVLMLERWKVQNPGQRGFILQEFQSGIEMAVGGWFGKKGWAGVWCENFEHKKLMSGDSGVNTGEQGTAVMYVKESKLADKLLKPLTSFLHSINYTGYFDMAAIIADDGTPYPLESTARPGWPIRIIQEALHVGDPAQWMLDLLNGEDTLEVLDEIAIGVVVSIPDYPYTEYTGRDASGFPIYNCDNLLYDCIHLCDAMMGTVPDLVDGEIVDVEMPVTSGDYVLIATGTDYTVTGAQMRAKRAIKKVEIPNSPGWRDDIGERLKAQLEDLHDMGYATEWRY